MGLILLYMAEKDGTELALTGFATLAERNRENALGHDLFTGQVLRLQLRQSVSKNWDTNAAFDTDLLTDALIIHTHTSTGGLTRSTLLLQGCVVEIIYGYGNLYTTVAATTVPAAQAIIDRLLALVPPMSDDDESIVVGFATMSQDGTARTTGRKLSAPVWSEATPNYTLNVQKELGRYLEPNWQPGAGGKLLLWHGPPGTGKTYAIRALTRAWKSWCAFSCVTDPENFLGHSSYMLDLLTRSTNKPWQLVILEDSGELLSTDAKDRTGQGLSRLLNASDGLIGQGLNVMTLITTNEPLKTLHPAAVRPGRCLSQVSFGEFTQTEANQWLANHASNARVRGPRTLAQLYAVLNGELEADETAVSEKAQPRHTRLGFQLQKPATAETFITAQAPADGSSSK